MVEIAANPTVYGLANIGGKSVDHITWYEQGRGPVTAKETMDIVADDGTIYRWTRFSDREPWTFEFRVTPDGERDSAARRLPRKIRTLVDRSPNVLYS